MLHLKFGLELELLSLPIFDVLLNPRLDLVVLACHAWGTESWIVARQKVLQLSLSFRVKALRCSYQTLD
jgi:hypothetical protein